MIASRLRLRRFPQIWVCIVLLIALLFSRNQAYKMSDFDVMEVQLGADLGIDRDKEIDNDTVKKVMEGVEAGNRDSIYFFALMKLYGLSLSKEVSIAAHNFEKAARLGHPEATSAYGMMLLHGQGVEKDESLALTFFRRGVQLKDTNSHWMLGKLLMEGKAVTAPVHKEAFELFQYAAAQNVPQAQHLLGVMYEYALGHEPNSQDFANAAEQYRRASGQNYMESSYHLALMYAYGRIPPSYKQDFRKALALLERGARAEHAPSVYYMGVFKLHGYGGMPDYERALNWFERAAGMGDFRISEKSAEAASELRALIKKAEDANSETLTKLANLGDWSGGADAASEVDYEDDEEEEEEGEGEDL